MTVQSGDYSVIRYEPHWKEQVVELQRLLWDPDPAVNSAYFDWKYRHHTGSANPLVYLAIQENHLVGMRGFSTARWQAGHPAALVDFLRAGDLVVAPAHRGRWLLQRIMSFAEPDLAARDHQLLLNLSASPSTYLGSLRQGWRSIGTYDTMRRETWSGRATAFTHQNLARIPLLWRLGSPEGRATSPSRAFARLDRLIGQRPARIGAVTATQELRAAAMASLIQRLDWDGRLRELRSVEFLEWRYQNPLGQYRYFYHGEPELEGYLVLHTRRRASPLNPPPVNIVDWEAVDDRVREELLRAAITACRPRMLDLWAVSCSSSTREQLKAHGFRPIDTTRGLRNYRPSVLIKHLPAGARRPDHEAVAGRRLEDPENWDLRMLYSDNY